MSKDSKYTNGNSVVYFKDAKVMKEVKSESVALVVTSPPYYNFVEYGNIGIGTETSYQDYIDNLVGVFKECQRVLIPDGKICVNITNMKARTKIEGKTFLYPITADLTHELQKLGLVFWDELIWVKGDANNGALGGKPLFGSYPYPPNPKMLDSIFENILIFKKDGKLEKRVSSSIKEESKLTQEEWMNYTKGVWLIAPDRNINHPASFPVELPYRLIKLYTFKGETVLDPFAGSGTTVAIANALGRVGIGYEIFDGYRDFIKAKFAHLGSPDKLIFGIKDLAKEKSGDKTQLSYLDE